MSVRRSRSSIAHWAAVVLLASISLVKFARGAPLDAASCGVMALVATLPAMVTRQLRAHPPWEATALTVVLVTVQVTNFVEEPRLSRVATYGLIATLSWFVVIYLYSHWQLTLTRWFVSVFVLTTTMATTGVWVIARWSVDLFFHTALLQTIPGVASDLFFGSLSGVLSGLVFVPYFDKRVSGNYRELWGDPE